LEQIAFNSARPKKEEKERKKAEGKRKREGRRVGRPFYISFTRPWRGKKGKRKKSQKEREESRFLRCLQAIKKKRGEEKQQNGTAEGF